MPAIQIADVLRLPPQKQLNLSGRIKFDHHARHLVDRPDVVLRIDAHLLGHEKAVQVLADLANIFAAFVELEQPCAAVRKWARGPVGHRRMPGAGEHEDVAPGVGRDPRGFAHVNVVGPLQRVRRRIKCNLGSRDLSRGGNTPHHGRDHRKLQNAFHGDILVQRELPGRRCSGHRRR